MLTPLRKLHVSPSSAPPGTLRARSDVQWRDSGQKLQSLIADEELKRVEKLVAKLCKGKDIKVERKKKKPVAKGYSRNIGPGQSGQS